MDKTKEDFKREMGCTCKVGVKDNPIYGGYARCPIHDPNMQEVIITDGSGAWTGSLLQSNENQRKEIASLTSQLEEVKKERESAREELAEMTLRRDAAWKDLVLSQKEAADYRRALEESKQTLNMTPKERLLVQTLIKSYNDYISALSEETFLLRKKAQEFSDQTEVRTYQIEKQKKARELLASALKPFIP